MRVRCFMKDFFKTFSGYIRRGIISPAFLISTALCTLLMFFFVADQADPKNYYNLPGLHYFLDRVAHIGMDYLIMMIAAFPAAIMFYDDWKSGYFKFIILRTGRRKYTFAVTFAAGVTAAAVMILSYTVLSIYILSKFPAVTDVDMSTLRISTLGFPNSGLLYTGQAFLCYLLYFLTRGAMAAFFAVFAVFQSMLITNRHLTLISPVLIYILYFSFNLFSVLPAVVNPFVLYWNGFKLYLVFGGTPDGSLFSPIAAIYPTLFTIAIMVALALVEAKILHSKMNRSI